MTVQDAINYHSSLMLNAIAKDNQTILRYHRTALDKLDSLSKNIGLDRELTVDTIEHLGI